MILNADLAVEEAEQLVDEITRDAIQRLVDKKGKLSSSLSNARLVGIVAFAATGNHHTGAMMSSCRMA